MANKRRKGGKIGRPPKIIISTDGVESSLPVKYVRKCGTCSQLIVNNEGILTWETMEFCNKICLQKFQCNIGSNCTNCSSNVKAQRLGKLCVRIGYKISQFCNITCLNKYREEAKICARCHKDITKDEAAVFADVGGGKSKDFCSDQCKLKYIVNSGQGNVKNTCFTCKRQTVSLELEHGENVVHFCGSVCYNAYKFSKSIAANQCRACLKYFENKVLEENSMYHNGETCSFCSLACKNKFINFEKKIMQCNTCKIQKYSFDLILLNDEDPPTIMCSLKCLSVLESSHSVKSSSASSPNSSLNNKATKNQISQSNKFVDRNLTPSSITSESRKSDVSTPVIEIPPPIAIKLPALPGPPRNVATMCKVKVASIEIITDPVPVKSIGIQNEIETNSVEVQTDDKLFSCLPIALPVSVPMPFMMYSAPYPVPFPFPLPLPVPIFIPTSRRTYKSVTKRVQKILDRSLQDPLQDEMLLLAQIASKDSKEGGRITSSSDDSESEPEKKPPAKPPPPKRPRRGGRRTSFSNATSSRTPPRRARFSKQNVSYVDYDNDPDLIPKAPRRTNKRVSFNNDIGSDRDVPRRNNRRVMFADYRPDEMESPYASINRSNSEQEYSEGDSDNASQNEEYPSNYREPQRSRTLMNDYDREDFSKRKRQSSPGRSSTSMKRTRNVNLPSKALSPPPSRAVQPIPPQPMPQAPQPRPAPTYQELFKKPESQMHLKHSIGVSAWQQWVQTRHPGRFNPDVLKLSPEELETSLCAFVNEVQKPNGQIYTPDTIYYFCLGIQQHLFLNGRAENIFYNNSYRRFTECLDEIAKKFLVLYNDSDFIVTRIEEEHLWESKQLGAHSPQVLLHTLLFFNTKYFNLTLLEEHKNLRFSHVVKNTRYTNKDSGRTRTVVLRYYPNGKEPQSQQGKPRKKKGFEQYENEDNPLRCPIRLYEFYISKCPPNIKLSNECFYLLPERSCLPESSVWYSLITVPDHEMDKVLNRFKIVREVTMALLAK